MEKNTKTDDDGENQRCRGLEPWHPLGEFARHLEQRLSSGGFSERIGGCPRREARGSSTGKVTKLQNGLVLKIR